MAAEAQAEGPALGPAPPAPHASETSPASPQKRGLPIPGDAEGEEERRLPEPKRRRACVAALDRVPGAAVAEDAPGSCCDADDDTDGACFSFQHARGGFLAPESTPKFGSFNPPGEAQLKPAEAEAYADAEAPDDEVPAASAREARVEDDGSQLVAVGECDGQVET